MLDFVVGGGAQDHKKKKKKQHMANTNKKIQNKWNLFKSDSENKITEFPRFIIIES